MKTPETEKDFEFYGPEWEREVMKFSKKMLIDWLRKLLKGKNEGWIPIEEKFPNETALLATKSKIVVIGDYYDGQWRVNGHWSHNGSTWISDYKFNDITHWMPLPEPPQQMTPIKST